MFDLLAVHPSYVIGLIFLGSFLITYVSIPVIIKVAEIKHLYDEPDFTRKVHTKKTPTLGGVAIFSGCILAFSIAKDFYQLSDIPYLVPALLIIFFSGIKDDVLVLTPLKKLSAQLMSAFLIVVLGQIRINSFYGLFGIQEIPMIVSILFSMLAIVTIINCYNLIDGMDGLAGSLGLVSLITYGTWFYFIEQWTPSFLAFSLAGGLLAFLRYNISPAHIFMGDTGAMLIGFVLSLLSIEFIEINKNLVVTGKYWVHASPSVAIGVMAVPIFDMLRVFALRVIRKRSPFKPDRNHIHHLLQDFGFSHFKAAIVLTLWSLIVIALSFSLRDMRSSLLLLILIFIVFVPSLILHYLRNKYTQAGRLKL